jgi:hypothetical protein
VGELQTALAELDLTRVPKTEGIALLLNAYNAFTVDLITRNFEGLKSIRDLSTQPFPRTTWNTHKFDLGGFRLTLDDVEHGNIRKKYDEPRIHAAVNCASVSCPDLRLEAYTGTALDQQLDEQTELWMGSPGKGLRLDRSANVLYLSRLFDWYGGDFVPPGVEEFACGYAPPGDRVCAYLSENDVRTEFMGYDWNLNSQAPENFTPSERQLTEAQAAALLLAVLESDAGPGLPGADFECVENCYSAADFAAINRPWNAVLGRHVAEGTIGGVAVAAVDYVSIDISPQGDLARYTV